MREIGQLRGEHCERAFVQIRLTHSQAVPIYLLDAAGGPGDYSVHAEFRVALLLLVRGLPSTEAASISRGGGDGQWIVAAAPEDAAAIERALHLLSRRPEKVAVIDPDGATPEGQKILARSDAFITKGGHIVYVNRQSEVLKGARQGATIYVCMLASIIWHEMAHLDGADEEGAQRREEGLWKRLLVEGRVDRVTALRYLRLMSDRHSGS